MYYGWGGGCDGGNDMWFCDLFFLGVFSLGQGGEKNQEECCGKILKGLWIRRAHMRERKGKGQ